MDVNVPRVPGKSSKSMIVYQEEKQKDFGIEYPHSNIKEIHLRECVREPSKSTFQTCFLSVLAAK